MGRGFTGPQRVGMAWMGQENFSHYAKQGGDGLDGTRKFSPSYGVGWGWSKTKPCETGAKTRDDNFSLPRLTRPSPLCLHGFSPPRKGSGAGMGQDFSPTPRGGAGMALDFLNPPCPAPPLLVPAPSRITMGYNCKFFIL